MRPSFFSGDDRALLEALRRGDPGASLALYDRHAPYLRRVLARVMGVDDELPELLHDTFVNALASIRSLRDDACLPAWLTRVAVFTARGCIRRRRRRRWLEFRAPEAVEDPAVAGSEPEDVQALRRLYGVLGRLGADERIVFALRYLEQMTVAEAASACGISAATVKRRLARAEKQFCGLAREDPVLRTWVEESPRWRER
ncbi:MAG: sigma-70 family RNA polymerase sigma factor [Deltaproteobacteria bacterium]|nr:sigma-70 family RNA polymerase sigma factor [Deltaproteobacteria bacterium]